jgi:hypothetical protein
MSALIPFVFGHGSWTETWQKRIPAMADADDAVFIDVLDPQTTPFFKLMIAANAKAFGDMGMPAWVQLDCATLPTAMIGFARRAAAVDAALRADLEERAGVVVDDDALIPLAEYTALCTPEAGTVVGFSLYSLEAGLGLRAKAMGLLAMKATTQQGITQLDNSALKTHSRLGPLHILRVGVDVHSRPKTTLIYRLKVPAADVLAAFAAGTRRSVVYEGQTRRKARTALVAGDVVVDVIGDVKSGEVAVAVAPT